MSVPLGNEFDDALRQAKLEALAEFAAGAGHEINNPLATILGRTELLLRRIGRVAPSGERAEAQRDLHVIAGQVQRIRDMIGDLMLFARPPAPRLEPCDLAVVVRNAAEVFQERAAEQGVSLDVRCPEPVPISADPVHTAVVVSELIRNSLAAMPRGGVILVEVALADAAGLSVGRLTVSDDGPGLSQSDAEHLFDPYYSGRQAGRGLGFGLCKCWRIVQQHGGTIRVTPREGGGVVAIVEWPEMA